MRRFDSVLALSKLLICAMNLALLTTPYLFKKVDTSPRILSAGKERFGIELKKPAGNTSFGWVYYLCSKSATIFFVKYNNFTFVRGFDFDVISPLFYYYKPAVLNFYC